MNTAHAYIAYIACRLISGKRVASLYDLSHLKEVEITSLLDPTFLKEFDEKFMDYLPGYAADCTYKYTTGNGNPVEIFINGRTFIVHIENTSAYFIGNVQGDTVYLYDHYNSTHFKYRVIRCFQGEVKTGRALETGTKEEQEIGVEEIEKKE